MRKNSNLVIFILLLLVACDTKNYHIGESSQVIQPTNVATVTKIDVISTVGPTTTIPIPTDTPTITPILLTPSPWPTILFFITPDAYQMVHWQEFEKALAVKIIPTPTPEDVLCEWILLGQSEQEIYVWAFCQASGSIPTGVSVPAVIYINTDGAVQSVEFPGDGSLYPVDIIRLFPRDVQEKISNRWEWLDIDKLEAHLHYRLEHPGEPPLLILSATAIP